jgi:hypothetical protein
MKTDIFKDNNERCKQWEEFLEEYKEYLKRSHVTTQLLKIQIIYSLKNSRIEYNSFSFKCSIKFSYTSII